MGSDFVLFGPVHLLILAAIPASGALLSIGSRSSPSAAKAIRLCLGIVLLVNELIWYAYRLWREGFRFPEGLPLQLCDLALWMTVLALLTLKPWSYEIAYFAGLGGSSMAIFTPDLWAPACSYPTCYFFLAHGGVIASVLYLTWGGRRRPRPGCVRRCFGALNLYALAVGIFNISFGTNYMYLCRKPGGASLLDYMGPWPVYVIAAEMLALSLFTLLWLPFRGVNKQRAVQ